jgi:MazG family protein
MKALLEIMARLRDPATGCPWDVQQTFATIAPYTIEEAYEVADAIERGDLQDLKEELGDLLLQVVFHAQMAKEQGAFDFDEVVTAICDKLVRRHPHVFAGESSGDARTQLRRWEEIKAAEKSKVGKAAGALAGIPHHLPALMRAAKAGKRAASMGFDWPDHQGARLKIAEELAELDAAIGEQDRGAIEHELGDLLLASVNLARHLGVDPETALRRANGRFESRFGYVEAQVAAGRPSSLSDLEAYWEEAKRQERGGA